MNSISDLYSVNKKVTESTNFAHLVSTICYL